MAGLVTVACKLPKGLILEIAGRPRVTVNGFSTPYGVVPQHTIIGGYGLTPNVDADFFEEWMMLNEGLDLVKNRFIFAYPKTADASANAKEMAAEKSGLEALDPDNPGRGLERVGVDG
jgi:hypothetical protein